MKNILLGTTVLVGAALAAGAASAESPKVTVGGFVDFQYGATFGDDNTSVNSTVNSTNTRGSAFRSDTEITFRIDGKSGSGLGYGGGIDLEADASNDVDVSTTNVTQNASRTFVYLEGSKWGRVQMGSDYGVTNTMKVDASSIARATGGIDGAFTYFFNAFGGTVADNNKVIATPDLITDYGYNGTSATGAILGDESTETANKISYYTPRFMGLQLGASYIIDTGNKGQIAGGTAGSGTHQTGTAANIVTWGANWQGNVKKVGIELGATGEWGAAETTGTTTKYQQLKTWQAGSKLSYMGFSLAGSYGSWGNSLRTADHFTSNYFWTLGGAYEMGPVGLSLTYLKSRYEATISDDNDFSNLSLGADYKLAPGLTPYMEVSFVSYRPDATTVIDDNRSTVFITGTQLAF